MRLLLLLGSVAQATQVTLREGEAGRLGTRRIQVLEVQDRRCGPLKDCLADVTARVRVRQEARILLLTLRLPQSRLPRWSGVGVVRVSEGTSPRVTLTDQPPGSQQRARQVRLLGLETWRCPRATLCPRPVVISVYLQVRWGKGESWLRLEYPAPSSPPGVNLIGATAGPRPALTFSDRPR